MFLKYHYNEYNISQLDDNLDVCLHTRLSNCNPYKIFRGCYFSVSLFAKRMKQSKVKSKDCAISRRVCNEVQVISRFHLVDLSLVYFRQFQTLDWFVKFRKENSIKKLLKWYKQVDDVIRCHLDNGFFTYYIESIIIAKMNCASS